MAAQRELVLGLPGDRVDPGELLRAGPERDRPLLGHPRVDHPPPQGGRPQLLVIARERALGLQQDPRRPAHRLDPTHQHDRGVAGLDRPAGLGGRLEARRAEPVDGRSRDAGGQPVEEPRHPRDVAVVLAGLVGIPEQDVIDPARIELRRAVEQRAHRVRGEIVGPHGRQASAVPAEGCSDRIDKVRRAHCSQGLY